MINKHHPSGGGWCYQKKGGSKMNLHKLIFTKCDSYKAATKITPKGVMVHSTGANNPNLKRYVNPDDGLLGKNTNNNHYNMPNVGKSVHAFIGKLKDGTIATYQVLPFTYKSGHCGTGTKGKAYSANNTHISFEICEDNLKNATYFKKVYQEAVEFTAYLCKEYNLDPMKDGVIICHSEGYKRGIASNHGDVMHWFPKHGKSMNTFRADVKALLSTNDKKSGTTNKTEVCTVEVNVLKKGDKNNPVKAMQTLLVGYGYKMTNGGKTYGVDGSFGAATENAVKAFQKANKLTVDGVCGPKTWTKLLGV
jgi:N-acetyl-anhydromuramyl-L-alanine amidase AmpD